MVRIAVLGLGWGDNSKLGSGERIIHYNMFLEKGDRFYAVQRFSGAGNSGQKSCKAKYKRGVDEKGEPLAGKLVKSHVVPYPVWDKNIFKHMGAGTAIVPEKAVREVTELIDSDFVINPLNYGISNRAHVTLWYHLEWDSKKEKGKDARGTTGNGVSPTFGDMAYKNGITFEEFIDPDAFHLFLKEKRNHISQMLRRPFRAREARKMERYYEPFREFLAPFMLNEATFWQMYGDTNMIEGGNQGVGLCPVLGSIPDTSSSTPSRTPGNTHVRLGVMKIPESSVGKRTLVTQMPPKVEKVMRGKKGEEDAEFGVTTGRPRQVLWPDMFRGRYEADVADIDGMVFTKFDLIRQLKEAGCDKIRICVGYRERGGGRLREYPGNRYLLKRCEPIYEDLPISGKELVPGINDVELLPKEEREILDFMCDKLGRPWAMVTASPLVEGTMINKVFEENVKERVMMTDAVGF